MIATLLQFFGCSHRQLSAPITPIVRAHGVGIFGKRKPTYVVCTRCGTEFEYSLSEMRIGARIEPEIGRKWQGKEITA